jgi:hypothetical protein
MLAGVAADADINVGAPTPYFFPVEYGWGNSWDYVNDQQTGSNEADFVGDLDHPSAYIKFDDAGTPLLTDGALAFRVRLGEDKSPSGFSTAVKIGMDIDPDGAAGPATPDGALDLFVGVDNSGSRSYTAIWEPGTSANVSPSTTSLVSPPYSTTDWTAGVDYDWRPVDSVSDPTATNFDLDGGGKTDYFLTFTISFSDIVAKLVSDGFASINENTPISYVFATSTQDNALNQDLNGVQGGVKSDVTWEALGAVTIAKSSVSVVPEPASIVTGLGLALLSAGGIRRRRRSLKSQSH